MRTTEEDRALPVLWVMTTWYHLLGWNWKGRATSVSLGAMQRTTTLLPVHTPAGFGKKEKEKTTPFGVQRTQVIYQAAQGGLLMCSACSQSMLSLELIELSFAACSVVQLTLTCQHVSFESWVGRRAQLYSLQCH